VGGGGGGGESKTLEKGRFCQVSNGRGDAFSVLVRTKEVLLVKTRGPKSTWNS